VDQLSLEPRQRRGIVALLTAIVALAAAGGNAFAGKAHEAGATEAAIRIGNIMPYSGPASAYGVIGKTEAAYFRMVNDRGGINGRRIDFISYDDAYTPSKTVEQTRKLVESDGVLLIFNGLGTATQTAVQKYMNGRKVPQLFVASGASKWNAPKQFAWTMGWQPSYRVEAQIFAKYILKTKPGARVAVLHANDDFGKDYVNGLRDIFGDGWARILAAEESYENSEPSIDSRIVRLKDSGADVLVNVSTPKFAAQAIRKAAELGWKPMQLLTNVSISIGAVMAPAGFEASEGVLSAGYLKDPSDPQWVDDDGMKEFMTFANTYMPGADLSDAHLGYGFAVAQTMEQVLRQCGDDLTRANIMKQAASLNDFMPSTLMPEIKVNTGAADFAPIEQLRMMQFRNGRWVFFGDTLGAEAADGGGSRR
jgi:ABC-type branched-subunit amino acid transport system substrate-binding protein